MFTQTSAAHLATRDQACIKHTCTCMHPATQTCEHASTGLLAWPSMPQTAVRSAGSATGWHSPLVAELAGEAVEVIHVVSGPHHHLEGGDQLAASSAVSCGAKEPAEGRAQRTRWPAGLGGRGGVGLAGGSAQGRQSTEAAPRLCHAIRLQRNQQVPQEGMPGVRVACPCLSQGPLSGSHWGPSSIRGPQKSRGPGQGL